MDYRRIVSVRLLAVAAIMALTIAEKISAIGIAAIHEEVGSDAASRVKAAIQQANETWRFEESGTMAEQIVNMAVYSTQQLR